MKLELGSLLKTAATAAFQVTTRAVGFGALGLGLNGVLFVIDYSTLSAMGGGAGDSALARATPLLLGGAFHLLMPVGWFFVGQKHGIQVAIRTIVAERKSFLVEYLIRRFAAKLETPEWRARIARDGLHAALKDALPAYLGKLDNMPWALRLLFRVVVGRVDVGGFLTKIVDERQMRALDVDALCDAASLEANRLIDEELLSVSPAPLLVLAAVNVGAVVAVLAL